MLVDLNGLPVKPTSKDLDPKEVFSDQRQAVRRANEERRRGQWFSNYGPTVANIALAPGTLRKPLDTPPFGTLRGLARESLIDQAIISRRVEDIRGLSRKVIVPGKQRGWRVVHRRFDDPNFDTNDENIQRRCLEMEQLLQKFSY